MKEKEECPRSNNEHAYFETKISEDTNDLLVDNIPDETSFLFVDTEDQIKLRETAEKTLRSSSKKDLIIQLRLGLVDGRSRTREEIAQELNVPVVRVRQIEAMFNKGVKPKQIESRRKLIVFLNEE